MKKYILFLAFIVGVMSCNTHGPGNYKSYVGTWEPILGENLEIPDIFVITSDSIKAINCKTKKVHYQCHYKILRSGVVELERCWLTQENMDAFKESYYVVESEMYIDPQGYLIISPFDNIAPACQVYPNYANLKLRKHEKSSPVECNGEGYNYSIAIN